MGRLGPSTLSARLRHGSKSVLGGIDQFGEGAGDVVHRAAGRGLFDPIPRTMRMPVVNLCLLLAALLRPAPELEKNLQPLSPDLPGAQPV